jgi:PTH1 family peptidyl-tRNA hydrolase
VSLKLIVGLGNPGSSYTATRHNAGRWFFDLLEDQYSLSFKSTTKFFGDTVKFSCEGDELWALIPHGYMNDSGKSVAALANFYKFSPEQILIVHDELDLPPGSVRLKQGGGHGGHNGLRSIEQTLGSRDFWRLRVGIGHPGDKSRVTAYVLSAPSSADKIAINAALKEATCFFPDMVHGNQDKVMNELHR